MKLQSNDLITPILVNTTGTIEWPSDERVFYVLGSNGLFLCRNHQLFRSCVPARNYPSELGEQDTFLKLRCPKVPRRLLELIVGFFARVGKLHGSEAGVILAWDNTASRMRIIVPPQKATVSTSSWRGTVYPIGLHYETPTDLPKDWTIIGDVHSHVDEAAYASGTDKHDEKHRAGLHIVVGRLYREPPEFHLEAVVDGTRFEVPFNLVFEGYKKRRLGIPQDWLDKLTIEDYSKSSRYESSYVTGYGTSVSSYYSKPYSGGGYKGYSRYDDPPQASGDKPR
jgi:proteasome lid subunit RPN8/RPN11